MNSKIDHQLLDRYESVKGELEKLPPGSVDHQLWEIVDQLLLDLHMIRYGYASEGYEKYLDRRLAEVCVDGSVADRMRAIRL